MAVVEEKTNPHAGHRDRMRKKVVAAPDMLEAHELVELLLYGAYPRCDTNPIAHRLMGAFGSIDRIFDATYDELMSIGKISHGAASLVVTVKEIMRRVNSPRFPKFIRSPSDAAAQVAGFFINKEVEELLAVFLGRDGAFIGQSILGHGTAKSVEFCTTDILRIALNCHAKSVLLCHNHPHAPAFPSEQDLKETQTVRAVLDAARIPLLDHLIVAADGTVYSIMRETALTVGVKGLFQEPV